MDADFLEQCSEHLQLRLSHWIFDGKELTPEIQSFVNWCIQQDKIDLHVPRGRNKKSYFEIREEKNRPKSQYYEDSRYCDHCDKETMHNCKDSDHERDSSGDYQECLECEWYMTGYDRKYTEPYK